MKPDTFTNTPEDAAAYEAVRGAAEWIDDRPTLAELEADHFDDWRWHREQQRAGQRPDPWLPWTCQRCGIETPGGQPEVCECGFRNYGEAS